jgi:hypothetical protein
MRIATLGFVIAMSTCAWDVVAAEATDAQQYTVKQTAPSLGSNVRRDVIKAGAVPLDKRYDELTAEQKDILKSSYEKMKAEDEPPFPAKGLMPIVNAIRDAHEQTALQYKGPLTLYVDVDSSGNAKSVSVVQSPDKMITQVAAMALVKQTYKPAVCDGKPCAMQYPFHVDLIALDEKDMQSMNPASGTNTAIKIKP